MKAISTVVLTVLLLSAANLSLAQEASDSAKADIRIDKYMPLVRPYIPIFPYLDEQDSADLSTSGADQDTIDDAQRMLVVIDSIRSLFDEQDLDVSNPEDAEKVRLAISVMAAFDQVRSSSSSADTDGSEADLLGDVAKAVIIGSYFSDSRLKEGIIRVATSPKGVPIYEYSYIGTNDRWRGVMAQDILATHPDAVTVGPFGMYMVNYDKLDVIFERVSM